LYKPHSYVGQGIPVMSPHISRDITEQVYWTKCHTEVSFGTKVLCHTWVWLGPPLESLGLPPESHIKWLSTTLTTM